MNKIKKVIYILVGLVAFVLGTIGVILPVLPTTPFYLLASFCFMKGSERFDKWFKGTKLYKKHLETFVNNRAMTLKQKLTILGFADLMLLIPLITLKSLHLRLFIVFLLAYKYYYFMFKIKTIKEESVINKNEV